MEGELGDNFKTFKSNSKIKEVGAREEGFDQSIMSSHLLEMSFKTLFKSHFYV